MTEFDEPAVIADRAAKAAKQAITDAAEVANRAFTKINAPDGGPGNFTAGDALKTMSQLMRIAATGAIGLARAPIQAQHENRPLLLADHIASVAARTAGDIDLVVQEAAEQVDHNTFTQNQWVQTAVKLTSIAMIRGAEVIETVGAGPGRYQSPWLESDDLAVHFDGAEADFAHRLTLESLGRPGRAEENIAALAVFSVKGGLLDAGKPDHTFRVQVNAAGIPSGLFQGVIRVCRDGDPTDEAGLDKTIPVTIVL